MYVCKYRKQHRNRIQQCREEFKKRIRSDSFRIEKKKKEKEKEEGRKIKRIASFDEFVEFRVSIFEISTNSPDGMETTIRKG